MVWSDITANGAATTTNTNSTTMSSTSKDKTVEDNRNLDVDDFLNLLVAEMQYQDPLEPSDNSQYIAQMATFTQVEATTQMQAKVEQQTASDLVGKTVIMNTDQNKNGYIVGTVDYWENISDKIYLGIDGKLYDLSDLDTVMDDDYYKTFIDGLDKTETDTTDKAE